MLVYCQDNTGMYSVNLDVIILKQLHAEREWRNVGTVDNYYIISVRCGCLAVALRPR